VQQSLDSFFNEINKVYVERGMWWRVVPGHYWVELRIDLNLKEDMKKLEMMKRGGGEGLVFQGRVPNIIIEETKGIRGNATSKRRTTQFVVSEDVSRDLAIDKQKSSTSQGKRGQNENLFTDAHFETEADMVGKEVVIVHEDEEEKDIEEMLDRYVAENQQDLKLKDDYAQK